MGNIYTFLFELDEKSTDFAHSPVNGCGRRPEAAMEKLPLKNFISIKNN
jgi:hypothetical protein